MCFVVDFPKFGSRSFFIFQSCFFGRCVVIDSSWSLLQICNENLVGMLWLLLAIVERGMYRNLHQLIWNFAHYQILIKRTKSDISHGMNFRMSNLNLTIYIWVLQHCIIHKTLLKQILQNKSQWKIIVTVIFVRQEMCRNPQWPMWNFNTKRCWLGRQ